jgi:hypothetical protein
LLAFLRDGLLDPRARPEISRDSYRPQCRVNCRFKPSNPLRRGPDVVRSLIERTIDANIRPVEHVRINHSRVHILVACHF